MTSNNLIKRIQILSMNQCVNIFMKYNIRNQIEMLHFLPFFIKFWIRLPRAKIRYAWFVYICARFAIQQHPGKRTQTESRNSVWKGNKWQMRRNLFFSSKNGSAYFDLRLENSYFAAAAVTFSAKKVVYLRIAFMKC